MRDYVSYLRVSTNRQGQSGLGLEAQREAVARHISLQAGVLIAEQVEVESGSKSSRPVLQEAIKHCRKEKAVLVIAKLDRLARNVAFISSLMESGVEFVAVDAPYANKLMLHILAAFAEHEREQISIRTKQALAAAKARGVKLGANGPNLARKNRERAHRFAQSMRGILSEIDGLDKKTYAEIAFELNSRQFPTMEGGRWYPMTVSRVLGRLNEVG